MITLAASWSTVYGEDRSRETSEGRIPIIQAEKYGGLDQSSSSGRGLVLEIF